MISAVAKTSARAGRILAPRAVYSESGNPAFAPAPASTTTSRPALARMGTTAGTIATRRSPGKISRGIPMIMKKAPTDEVPGPEGRKRHTAPHREARENRACRITDRDGREKACIAARPVARSRDSAYS